LKGKEFKAIVIARRIRAIQCKHGLDVHA
jgi:hypothetical protein